MDKDVVHIYTVEYQSQKKNEIMPFAATWMDLEIIMLRSKSDRERQILWYHSYVESKKVIQMNLFIKQKQSHKYRNQTYGYQKGKEGNVKG